MSSAPRPELEVAALSGEVEAVMRGIVDRLMQLPLADGASLSTVDDEFAYFRVCAGEDAALQDRVYRLEETLGAACVNAEDIVVLRKNEGPEVDRCLTGGAASIVLAPLEWDGKIRGILGVRSASEGAFDESGVEHIRMLAAGASIALRNAEVIEVLAASERSYRELHDSAADANLVMSLDGDILDVNEAAATMLGRSTDELRAMHVRELFSPAELTASPLRLDELRATGFVRAERPFLRKDGTEIMVEYSCRALADGRVHASMRDVTQRKRHEERLRSNLGRLHAIIETQQEISALELDPEAVTAALVQRAQRLAGGDGASVQWFDGHESVMHHCSGIASAHVGMRLDRGGSLAGVAARSGEAAYAADTETDPRVDSAATKALGARSLICAPLYRNGRVEGVLSVMARRARAFDELAIETTRLMAEFVSTVIRNASELEVRRLLVEQLRTQEQVVEHMRTGLWVWALDGDTLRLEYGNEASEAATGVVVADVVGLPIEEVLPGIPGALRDRLIAVVETGELFDAGEIEYGDSRVRPGIYSLKAFPLSGERVAVTFDNVTEMTRSRRALQESEARFRGAFHSTGIGMALTTLDGSFVQVNDRLAEMLGYTVEELMRNGVEGITLPEDLDEEFARFARLSGGEIDDHETETRYVRKDGSLMWGHLSASVIRSYDGSPSHVVVHVQDITKQKEASLLFESTFERSSVPKVVFDDDQRIVNVNQSCAALLGTSVENAIGLAIADLTDANLDENWGLFQRAGTLEGEASLKGLDGRSHIVEFVATANVQPGLHIAVIRDLTRQKELESQLRQAQKMEAVGRLAGGIAHDFNNLLTAITGYSEFLISGEQDDRLRRYAEEIKKAAARAAALTGQLLAFSRRQVLQPRVLDLNAVVSDMDMMLRRLIGEDIELVTMLSPDLAPVQADPTQVEQVIVNLAVNARDAMPNGGSVTIETSTIVTGDGEFVELRLTDTGVGMTEAERQQLFDPFFTTKAGGTGLGLATVYGIVEQSGGTIEVDTAPGLGSSFSILLPAVEAEVEPPEQSTHDDAPAVGAETILLVEDESVVRHLVAEILESSGYTVLQAGDGPSALELLRRHSGDVDILVTDVVMPGMSGPEVASAVTAMRPGTHVLFMSGYTDSAIGHHGVLEPGIAFLQKPFSADDLTRKVRAVIDGASVAVD